MLEKFLFEISEYVIYAIAAILASFWCDFVQKCLKQDVQICV